MSELGQPIRLVVIGQGYVGLPLSKHAAAAGIKVVGLERSAKLVADLNRGLSHVDDISDDDICEMLGAGYVASADPRVISDADCVLICVPTPLDESGAPDLDAVKGATATIAGHMTTGTLVVLESTTYPGTTRDLVLPVLESSGLKLDTDFHLAFSPERIDPGNAVYGLKNTPKVVGGVSAASTLRASEFYSRFVDTVVPVKSAQEAEMSKLLENTYRHVNIALVNEMAKFCHELDIDLWEVISAAATKPFGFQAFYPGPGVGGHCIPIDPNYLSFEVRRTLGYPFRFVELAQEINNSMPRYIVDRVQEMLNQNKKALNGSKVLILGVTYKSNISDQRESPAVAVAENLIAAGVELSFHDPYVHEWKLGSVALSRVQVLEESVDEADLVLLLQSHSGYDFDQIAHTAHLLLDTRGVISADAGTRL